jgi:hypothetical protein
MEESRDPVDHGRPVDWSVLWRGVPAQPSFIVMDHNTGTYRVSSAAFDDPEMSVAIAEEAATIDYLTRGSDAYGVVAFTAGFARSQGQIVIHDPWPAEPAHALVLGSKPRRVCRAFAQHVRWAHRPRGYDENTLPDPS